MSERLDAQTQEWPLRPWIMAALAAIAGLLFHLLTDSDDGSVSAARQAGATFVAIATLSFLVTVERLRWPWAFAFALGWGLVIAFVGWFSAGYNREGEIFEWPYFSALFAVIVAAPLFQTIRDEGAWRFPYGRLHSHAWADAVIGAASLFFTGVTFLLAWLIAGLFDLIGIDLLKELLRDEWFDWILAGFAFGGAFGLLRERDRLVATLQRLVMVVFSVLAPVLALALVVFLLSIPFTGLQGLWDSWVSAAGLLLAASAGAILLANAVIADGRDERATNPVLLWSALALAAVVLPLAVLAGLAMGIRINEYGWTPERIWGAIAVGVAIAYGLAGWWSIWRGRRDFDDPLRPAQTNLAIAVCGVALFLALPILDFGAISARSQLARLESGRVEPQKFDWAAMAFDFGPAGRKRLADIARTGPAGWRAMAASALKATKRWTISERTRAVVEADEVAKRIRVASPGLRLTPEALRRIAQRRLCPPNIECAVLDMGRSRLLVVMSDENPGDPIGGIVMSAVIDLSQPADVEVARPKPAARVGDLSTARIEVRPAPGRQLYVDGQPVGEPFE
ncbi:DUF4153 domain-containing protein [Sphingomonas sp.]|uniref:DUF4153 domain-containing protein n=1 Tax=Sphingomonas sp. TaxID=28214 RepID=UPI0017F18CFE|nr:DUF4153 domain-containing protein [Sphingomonas sp.]MBA3512033.1 DUF4153 domain-containing protein [Sphingomonas sp.]